MYWRLEGSSHLRNWRIISISTALTRNHNGLATSIRLSKHLHISLEIQGRKSVKSILKIKTHQTPRQMATQEAHSLSRVQEVLHQVVGTITVARLHHLILRTVKWVSSTKWQTPRTLNWILSCMRAECLSICQIRTSRFLVMVHTQLASILILNSSIGQTARFRCDALAGYGVQNPNPYQLDLLGFQTRIKEIEILRKLK